MCASCKKLLPLATTGDGNCLLHAASLGETFRIHVHAQMSHVLHEHLQHLEKRERFNLRFHVMFFLNINTSE